MLVENKLFYNRLTRLIGIIFFSFFASFAQAVTIYTPFTKLSVAPGESVDYSIDLINRGVMISNDEIRIVNLPKSWNYTLRSGSYVVSQVAVLGGDKKTLSLKVEVPFQVEKGSYTFFVQAGYESFPLTIIVTEKGSNETELSTTQANMQGNANSTFSYRAVLKNRTAEKQLYALIADAPRGWTATFQVDGKYVTSVEMDANTTKDINIELKASTLIEANKYKIAVTARSGSTSAKLDLEAVVTGSYEVFLTTPTGLVSTKVSTGREKKIQLIIRNTGSSELSNIEMKSVKPSKWEVLYDPTQIDKIAPGNEATVYVTIQADNKSIPGDYMVNLEARTPETSSKIALRVMVKTPMIWGWIGIFIILAALWSVFRLFKKYGRR